MLLHAFCGGEVINSGNTSITKSLFFFVLVGTVILETHPFI